MTDSKKGVFIEIMTVIRQDKGGRDSDRERDTAVIEVEKQNRKLTRRRWKGQFQNS